MEKEVGQTFCLVADRIQELSELQAATTKYFLNAADAFQSQIAILANSVASGETDSAKELQKIIASFGEVQKTNRKELLDAIARLESIHDGWAAQLIELKKGLGLES